MPVLDDHLLAPELRGVQEKHEQARGRRRRNESSGPSAASCIDCGKAFKSDLDMQWWNDDDPRLSRHVCTACFFALTSRRKQEADEAIHGAAKATHAALTEDAVRNSHDLLLNTHVHKWVLVDAPLGVGGSFFYCSECPFDTPQVHSVAAVLQR